MIRIDRCFSKLDLGYRSGLSDFYKKYLFETVDGYEGTRHVLWTHMRTAWGYPGHKMYGKVMPLNGYLLFKNDHFQLAADEQVVTTCGIPICCQTAHFKITPKGKKESLDK